MAENSTKILNWIKIIIREKFGISQKLKMINYSENRY